MEDKRFEHGEDLIRLIRGELELDSPEAMAVREEMSRARKAKKRRGIYLPDPKRLLDYRQVVRLVKRLTRLDESLTAEYRLAPPMTCGVVELRVCYGCFEEQDGSGALWKEIMLRADTVELSAVSDRELVVDIAVSGVLRFFPEEKEA